tara:strand:+ start:330 stop:551 length:222 start_codon:yes stop_codon:yes gene_type:complete
MSEVLETVQACASLWLMRATPERTGGEHWHELRKWTQTARQSGETDAAILEALQNGLNQGRTNRMLISPVVIG